jgi:hypothetical protein
MKKHFALILAAAFLSNVAFAADTTTSAVEKRYADDRKLCADEPSSATRMQCLRDAKAEYDKAVAGVAVQSGGAAKVCVGCGKVLSVRVIEKDGEGSTAGMVAGGLAGALLGTFFTNSDFSDIAPMPSILQSMSWSPSTRRMFLTLVPTLTTRDEPLILRSLITVTLSPSCSRLPLASRTTRAFFGAMLAAVFGHSWAHSGQTKFSPSS